MDTFDLTAALGVFSQAWFKRMDSKKKCKDFGFWFHTALSRANRKKVKI